MCPIYFLVDTFAEAKAVAIKTLEQTPEILPGVRCTLRSNRDVFLLITIEQTYS